MVHDMAEELDSKRCRIILGSTQNAKGPAVDIIFDRPLSAARLKALELFSNAEARLVYAESRHFSRAAALSSVPKSWQARTFEWADAEGSAVHSTHPSDYAYQFWPAYGMTRGTQTLLALYTIFSAFRVGFLSTLMSVLGPRGRTALYPLRKAYWFLNFQWQKRTSNKLRQGRPRPDFL